MEFAWYVSLLRLFWDPSPLSIRPINLLSQRVPPEEWYSYREVHEFRTPSCLCPVDPDQGYYRETAIVKTGVAGSQSGHYVATCAENLCGYLGA